MRIEVYDQVYHVQAEGDEKYLQSLATYVDEKMRSIAETTGTVDSLRVAILAALNMADELHSARERLTDLEGPLRKRVQHCVTLAEKALESAGTGD